MEEKYFQKIIEIEQSTKSAHHRIDKIESDIKEIKELTIAVKEIAMETRATREDVNDINSRLKEVETKPAQKWETIVKAGLGALGSGLVGAAIALILK